MRLTMTSVMVMVSGLIILGLPAIYFLTGHRIITSPQPVSETVGQRPAPVDQPFGASQPEASNGVTAPAPMTPEAQPTPARTHSAVTETTSAIPPCDKPDGLGLSRIVQIDTTGGPEFGVQHFKGYDFL